MIVIRLSDFIHLDDYIFPMTLDIQLDDVIGPMLNYEGKNILIVELVGINTDGVIVNMRSVD